MTDIAQGFCDLLYPPVCLLCRQSLPQEMRNDSLCTLCRDTIEFNIPPFCFKCSRHLDPNGTGAVCRQCRDASHDFDEAWAAVLYNREMRHLIHLFKYAGKTGLAKEFSRFIVSFLEQYSIRLNGYDLVVPVPLHSSRMRERGYNQGELLSRQVAEAFALPCVPEILHRRRATEYQARLSPKQRWTNIDGAFRINYPERFKNKSILVVDDLLTTGTTASEIAKILKRSGAGRVGVLTLAIADSIEH